ncbi:Gamma-aminobutyric acid (GABA) B receptor [Seminavis robusta]|uniref:Gamma-aminobutyric acid (GABA) B receptor n=1 Tax=Seminavis robusta TaxID=568900 RepID=A0A9N8ESX3_9STRA|nr:Gamma-aminobutyric acid (GABA) B receptor [Seminavis robusta]|eukprot:Sro1784_g297340.1 Gamma-aminobutyric acid (GABA) B receptor (899) ;mRNA; r:10630-13609
MIPSLPSRRPSSGRVLIWGLCCALLSGHCQGDIGQDGRISLLVAVPLTQNNEHVDPGWMHMASAVLAMDHFNTRNSSVVPELRQYRDCPIQFDPHNITVMDTGTNSHLAMEHLTRLVRQGYVPDAIAGPYNDLPALELSSFATGLKVPIVSHRASNYNLVRPVQHPYFTQLNPDLYGQMAFLGRYLVALENRSNYIAVVHGLDDATLQRVEILKGVLWAQYGIDTVRTFSYLSPATPMEGSLNRDIATALQGVNDSGYRTIIWMTAHTDADVVEMGTAAGNLGLDQGHHLWVVPGGVEITYFIYNVLYRAAKEAGTEESWWKFLQGAAYLRLVDRFQALAASGDDAFNQTLHSQNASFVQRLRELNPIPNYFDKVWDPQVMQSTFPPDDIFQQITYPLPGSSFMYDAVMAIGIGACNAAALVSSVTNNDTTTITTTSITGDALLEGIQSAHFTGASGEVRFHNLQGNPGSRNGSTVYYGISNLLPFGIDVNDTSQLAEESAFYHPDTREFVHVNPFYYADGTTHPPLPLRNTPDQNYLSRGIRAVGLTLFGIATGAVFVSVVFITVYRKHRIIVASQPPLLYLLCLGSAVLSLDILLSSFDESYGWTDDMLDKACLAIPWMDTMGHLMVYCALFTKLWRVQRVLQFKRRQIKVSQVMWPAAVLILAAIIILAVWSATGDHGWERTIIDPTTGESIGSCHMGQIAMFVIPLTIVNFIPTLLTLVMAWKTHDVDDLYSESKWIFPLILVQFQVILVGAPVMVLLHNLSTDGYFIGSALMTFTFPITNMGLICLPKMVAVINDGKSRDSVVSRGSRANGRVSGLSYNNDTNYNINATTNYEVSVADPTNRSSNPSACLPSTVDDPGAWINTSADNTPQSAPPNAAVPVPLPDTKMQIVTMH